MVCLVVPSLLGIQGLFQQVVETDGEVISFQAPSERPSQPQDSISPSHLPSVTAKTTPAISGTASAQVTATRVPAKSNALSGSQASTLQIPDTSIPAQFPSTSKAPAISKQTDSNMLPSSPSGWIKTFEDNFDGSTIDPAKWTLGFGWGSYDSSAWAASCAVPTQVSVDAGYLILSNSSTAPDTRECSGSQKSYSSAAINTKNKFSQQFGYMEARVRMPGKRGTLGAWWMHRNDGQWPPEIDIAEVLGGKVNELQMAIHYKNPTGKGNKSTGITSLTTDLSDGFHVYGVDWEPRQIVFYLDGVRQGSIDALDGALFQRGTYYLILNTMVCTSAVRDWCEAPNFGTLWDDTTTMQVDWVRVWTRAWTRSTD